MSKINVGVLVGSLRRDSSSLKLAKHLAKTAPESMELNFIDIGHLDLYNEDLETDNPPQAWTDYREAMKASDAIILVSPEYNRTMTGTMKNAIDVGSRPYMEQVFNDKPVLVVSTSGGALAGFGANHHMRQALTVLNAHVMAAPEAYLGNVPSLFDEQGELLNEGTGEFLNSVMSAFEDWISRLK